MDILSWYLSWIIFMRERERDLAVLSVLDVSVLWKRVQGSPGGLSDQLE